MKKIYAFSIDDDDVPSNKRDSDIRLIAYLLYQRLKYINNICDSNNDLFNYSDDSYDLLSNSDNIVFNKLLETISVDFGSSVVYTYRFISDRNKDIYDYMYDPFMIDENSFGITSDTHIYNIDKILNDTIKYALDNNLIDISYNFKIFECEYEKDSKRKHAVTKIHDEIDKYYENKKNSNGKKLIKSTALKTAIFSIMGR